MLPAYPVFPEKNVYNTVTICFSCSVVRFARFDLDTLEMISGSFYSTTTLSEALLHSVVERHRHVFRVYIHQLIESKRSPTLSFNI